MLRPIVTIGLALGMLAGPAAQHHNAQAQMTQPRMASENCLANGLITAGAFVVQPAIGERGTDTGMFEYAVSLRASRAMHMVIVSLPLGGRPAMGLEVELPVGQEVLARLGRRPGPRASEAELRAALRVMCQPA